MARAPADSAGKAAAKGASNAPEITVSELSQSIKRTVEDRFGYVRVRGEVSGYRGPHSSGHCYFSLKDQSARIDAVIWKGTFNRLRIKPEEGMEVVASGKITTYPGKSAYQIVIDAIEPAGVGALLAQLEERRRKLAAEGLFDDARKQLLPYLPRTIGVVTSPTGAVIRDILHRIKDRFPVHVLVWPVRVQGETSGAEVAAAIRGFNALEPDGRIPRPDVLIVARGGGSLEDLWGFNDEIVVRAAAESFIPLISAVGHETDWTLIDHAADLRAPTPTAAAEIAVPVRSELLAQLADRARRHEASWRRFLDRRSSDLRSLVRALPRAEEILAIPRQRLDRSGEQLSARLAAALQNRHIRVSRAGTLLARHSPQTELARRREKLSGLGRRLAVAIQTAVRAERRTLETGRGQMLSLVNRLRPAMARGIANRRAALSGQAQLLHSLGYRNVLARGFALVRDRDGRPVRRAASVRTGMNLNIEFADGNVAARAGGEGPATPDGGGSAKQAGHGKPEPASRQARKPARRSTRKSPPEGQGSLF